MNGQRKLVYTHTNGQRKLVYIYTCTQENWYVYRYIYNTHTHNEILSHKKEILPFVTTQMHLEGIMLSDISLAEKDKNCLISLICGM